LKELEETNSKQLSQFQEENNNLKKLMNLYKNYFEESTEKIQDLETRLEKQKENYSAFQKKLETDFNATAKDLQEKFYNEKSSLSAKIQELEASLVKAQQQSASSKAFEIPLEGTTSSTTSFLSSSAVLHDKNGREITVSDLYHQLLNTQKELMTEVNKKQEMEIYLNQILKDIELKAPMIAKQKRDYHRLVTSHTQLTQTLDNYVDENTRLKVTVHDLETRFTSIQKDFKIVSLTNQDLSQQIQHLLKANSQQRQQLQRYPSLGEESLGEMYVSPSQSRGIAIIDEENTSSYQQPQDIISSHLVTFNNVEELQEKNTQLLATIRRLTIEREQQEAVLMKMQERTDQSSDNSSSLLTDFQGELQELKSNQDKSEEMIKILIQQRDMYRSMLMNGTAEVASPQKQLLGGMTSPSAGSNALMTTTSNEMMQQQADSQHQAIEIINYQKKLEFLEKEKAKLLETMNRLEENSASLTTELTSTKDELLSLKLTSTSIKTELRYLQERNDRLESSNKLLIKENQDSLNRRSDLEQTFLSLQKQNNEKDNLLHEQFTSLRQLNEQLKRKEIDFEVLKLSENRLNQQISELKTEISNQVKLSDHLYRLETSITSKYEEEKNFYLKEKENIEVQFNAYRSEMTEKLIANETTIKLSENEVKTLSNRLMLKENDLKGLQESFTNEQSMSRLQVEKINSLEKQNSILQEKISNLSGEKIVDSILEKELSEKEILLSKALLENANLKKEISVNEEYIANFKNLSNHNEMVTKELKDKYASLTQETEKEKETLSREKSFLQQEMNNLQVSNNSLLNELENIRTLQVAKEKELQEAIHSLQQQLQSAQTEKESLLQHYSFIEKDYAKLQQSSAVSYENYERELQLHAESERLLKEEKFFHLKTKEKLTQLEEKISTVSMESFNLQQRMNAEKSNFEKELIQSKELISSLQSSNQVLMQQLENSNEKLEKLQSARFESLIGQESANATSSEQSASSSTATMFLQEELQECKKTILELKELLSYMKKEKEILSTKVNYLELENSRYLNQVNSLMKSTDELKVSLQQEIEKSSSGGAGGRFPVISGTTSNNNFTIHSQEEFNLLLKEIDSLNILRESNIHLRTENENLLKKLKEVETTYSQEKTTIYLPLQEKFRAVQQEKDNLELTNDQLSNDISYWKNRLHSLISRYNDIDPHEHQELQKKTEELTKQVQSLEEQLKEVTSVDASQKESIAAKEKELLSLKAAADGSEKNAGALRERLRLFKDKNTALETQMKEINKTSAQRDTTSTALETQVKDLNEKVKELSSENQEQKAALSNYLKEITVLKLHQPQPTTAATESSSGPQVSTPGGETTTSTTTAPKTVRKPPPRKRTAEAMEGTTATPTTTTSSAAAAPPAPASVSAVEETKAPEPVNPPPVAAVAAATPAAPAGKVAPEKVTAMQKLLRRGKPPAPAGPPPAATATTTSSSSAAPPPVSVPTEAATDEPKHKKARIEETTTTTATPTPIAVVVPPAREGMVSPAPVVTMKEAPTAESEQPEQQPPQQQETVTPAAPQEMVSDSSAHQEMVVAPPQDVVVHTPQEVVAHSTQEVVVPPSHEVIIPPSPVHLNVSANPFVPKVTNTTAAATTTPASSSSAAFTNPFAGTTTSSSFSMFGNLNNNNSTTTSAAPAPVPFSPAPAGDNDVEEVMIVDEMDQSQYMDEGMGGEEGELQEGGNEGVEEATTSNIIAEETTAPPAAAQSQPPVESVPSQEQKTPFTSAFPFGSSTTAPAPALAPAGSSSSLFGGFGSGSSSSLFGGFKPGSGTGLFGSAPAPSSAAATTTTTTAAPTTSIFGAKPATTPTNSTAAQQQQQSTSSSSLFGSTPSLFSASTSFAGSSQQPPTKPEQPTTTSSGGFSGLFGSSTTSSNPAPFSFGSSSTTSSMPFGTTKAPETSQPMEPVKETDESFEEENEMGENENLEEEMEAGELGAEEGMSEKTQPQPPASAAPPAAATPSAAPVPSKPVVNSNPFSAAKVRHRTTNIFLLCLTLKNTFLFFFFLAVGSNEANGKPSFTVWSNHRSGCSSCSSFGHSFCGPHDQHTNSTNNNNNHSTSGKPSSAHDQTSGDSRRSGKRTSNGTRKRRSSEFSFVLFCSFRMI
jgi:chromosome segregation ATPase